jgi:hypothetical protein
MRQRLISGGGRPFISWEQVKEKEKEEGKDDEKEDEEER